MLNPVLRYTGNQAMPLGGEALGRLASREVMANQAIVAGKLVAINTAVDANATVTFTTTGTGTAGTWRVTFPNGEYVDLAYNVTAAAMQTALRALAFFGQAGCTVAFTQADASVNTNIATLTYTGPLAAAPQTTPTVSNASLTGATIAAAAGTTGNGNGTLIAYDGTTITDPGAAAAITFTATGAGGSFGAGTYVMQATWVSSTGGETLPCIGKMLTLTAAQEVRVAAINAAGTPDDAQSLNIYMNGVLIKTIAVSTPGTGGNVAQTDIIAPAAGTYKALPATNTAYTSTKGAWRPIGVMRYDVFSNERGFVTYGTSNSPLGVGPNREAAFWQAGDFQTDDLVGLDQNAVTLLGARFLKGALGTAGSVLRIP